MRHLLNGVLTAALVAGLGTATLAQDRPVGEKTQDQPVVVMTEPTEILNKVHFIAQYDINASQIAIERTTNDDIKDFAKGVLKNQQALDKKITEVARELNIELTKPLVAGAPTDGKAPGTDDKRKEALDRLNRLQNLTGTEFDREYVSMMGMCADKTRSFLRPTEKALSEKKDDASEKVQDVVEKTISNAKDNKEDVEDVLKKLAKEDKKVEEKKTEEKKNQ